MESFDIEIYYAIILSILIISIVMVNLKLSLKNFTWSLLSSSSILVGQGINMKRRGFGVTMLLSSWVISCLVLSSAFSGQIRNQLLKGDTTLWIDSWHDLHKWKQMTIFTFFGSGLQNYIDEYPNDSISIDFKSRYIHDGSFMKSTDFYKNIDWNGIRRGKVALLWDRHLLDVLKRELLSDEFVEDIDFHISKSGDISQIVFMLTNKLKLDERLTMVLDKV